MFLRENKKVLSNEDCSLNYECVVLRRANLVFVVN